MTSNEEQNSAIPSDEAGDESKAAPADIGSWQCQRCYLTSMFTWRGTPNPDDAPACCGGELMIPYRITSTQRTESASARLERHGDRP